MPTYEYKCQDCGGRFEQFQSMTDDPLKECRFCGGRVKRLIGAGAGIIFKGSGFYSTDYRSSSYQQQAKRERDTKSGSGGKDASSDAGKSAAKGADKPKDKSPG